MVDLRSRRGAYRPAAVPRFQRAIEPEPPFRTNWRGGLLSWLGHARYLEAVFRRNPDPSREPVSAHLRGQRREQGEVRARARHHRGSQCADHDALGSVSPGRAVIQGTLGNPNGARGAIRKVRAFCFSWILLVSFLALRLN